jgi:pimeloyl-ACP methyl ester carboxylesterase
MHDQRDRRSEAAMSLVEVNGTTLYYEVRGQGPPFLMIPGTPGYSNHYAPVAELLADEFTVVTYDRRANSRSPRPPNWTSTSEQEQADDAAALLETLGLAPAAAFGLSSGGAFLANLIVRRPDLLTGAVFHEPAGAMPSDPDAVSALIGASFDAGMARGGRPAALESFLRLMCGDEVIDGMGPVELDRWLANADLFFDVESAMSMSPPTPEALRKVRLPCVVTAGADNRPPDAPLHFCYEGSQWLADCLGVAVTEVPGGHVPQASHPEAFAAALRAALRDFTRDQSADVRG